MLRARGCRVSGSDARDSSTVRGLVAEGFDIRLDHDARRVDGVDTLVVSSAIRDDNPELMAARAARLTVVHRSQALAAIAASASCRIAVAGANGKTTTASMLAVLASEAGWEPSYAVGGDPVQLPSNAALGTGEVFVIEADESDGSFVGYRPHVAVVTSVQPDHLDFYGSVEAVESGYRALVDTIEPGGVLVVCLDDPGARRLAEAAQAAGVSMRGYGTSADAHVRLTDLDASGLHTRATVHLGDTAYPLRLSVLGEHNLFNAVGALSAALAAAEATGIGDPAAPTTVATYLDLLSRFTGVRRRFERMGEARGVTVVDDYAHNPAKVRAAVETGRRAVLAPGRLLVAFQPHLYSRTKDFAVEFGQALAAADVVLVTDVYAAREDPLPGVTGALVAQAVRDCRAEPEVHYVPELTEVVPTLRRLARPGDLVLTVGAGDITTCGPALLDRLADDGPGGSQ